MTYYTGTSGKVTWGGLELPQVTQWGATFDRPPLPTTFVDEDFEAYVPGQLEVTGSFVLHYYTSSEAEVTVRELIGNLLVDDEIVQLRLLAGNLVFQFEALLVSANTGQKVGDVAAVAFDFVSGGEHAFYENGDGGSLPVYSAIVTPSSFFIPCQESVQPVVSAFQDGEPVASGFTVLWEQIGGTPTLIDTPTDINPTIFRGSDPGPFTYRVTLFWNNGGTATATLLVLTTPISEFSPLGCDRGTANPNRQVTAKLDFAPLAGPVSWRPITGGQVPLLFPPPPVTVDLLHFVVEQWQPGGFSPVAQVAPDNRQFTGQVGQTYRITSVVLDRISNRLQQVRSASIFVPPRLFDIYCDEAAIGCGGARIAQYTRFRQPPPNIIEQNLLDATSIISGAKLGAYDRIRAEYNLKRTESEDETALVFGARFTDYSSVRQDLGGGTIG